MAAPSGRRPLGQGFIRMIPVKVPVQSTGPEADLEVGAENAQPPEQSRQRAGGMRGRELTASSKSDSVSSKIDCSKW